MDTVNLLPSFYNARPRIYLISFGGIRHCLNIARFIAKRLILAMH
jgi:hypothetical protein